MKQHDSARTARIATPRRGNLLHSRRSVLLLLGFYEAPLHAGIIHYAREAHWVLDDNYTRIGIPPAGWRGDGILCLITNPKDVEALRHFPKVPLVDFSKGWISDSMPAKYRTSGIGRSRVLYDNACIGRMTAEHFLERGFKHIAYLNFGNYWMETERIPAFQQAIEAAGSHYYEIPYYKLSSKQLPNSTRLARQNNQWLAKTLQELPKPLGIAASVDNLAGLLLRACATADLSVPEEVAVLGCGNNLMTCDFELVPLSSVDCDWERLGYEGAKLLDQLMDGHPAPRKPILIPPKGVVTRQSTDILAVPDPRIAKAIRFIWDHYQEPIDAQKVATAAGLNRRKLERDFRQHLNQTVNNEINQTRIAHARKLLLETNLKTHEVAARCGFSGNSYFSKTFRRLTFTTPSQFRRKQAVTVTTQNLAGA